MSPWAEVRTSGTRRVDQGRERRCYEQEVAPANLRGRRKHPLACQWPRRPLEWPGRSNLAPCTLVEVEAVEEEEEEEEVEEVEEEVVEEVEVAAG